MLTIITDIAHIDRWSRIARTRDAPNRRKRVRADPCELEGLKKWRHSLMSCGWQATRLKRADPTASGSWFSGAFAVEARALPASARNCQY